MFNLNFLSSKASKLAKAPVEEAAPVEAAPVEAAPINDLLLSAEEEMLIGDAEVNAAISGMIARDKEEKAKNAQRVAELFEETAQSLEKAKAAKEAAIAKLELAEAAKHRARNLLLTPLCEGDWNRVGLLLETHTEFCFIENGLQEILADLEEIATSIAINARWEKTVNIVLVNPHKRVTALHEARNERLLEAINSFEAEIKAEAAAKANAEKAKADAEKAEAEAWSKSSWDY